MKQMIRLAQLVVLLAVLPAGAAPVAITEHPFEVMRSGDDLVLAFKDESGIKKVWHDLTQGMFYGYASLKDKKTGHIDYAGNHVWFVENFFYGFNEYDSEARMRAIAGHLYKKHDETKDFKQPPPWYIAHKVYEGPQLRRFDQKKGGFLEISKARRRWERWRDLRPAALKPFERNFLPDQ
jgi:hypothetical protein